MKNWKLKIVSFTSVLVLLILAILFIHSELGISAVPEKSHDQHDFCNLFTLTTIHNATSIISSTINLFQSNLICAATLTNLPENLSLFGFFTPQKQFRSNSTKLSYFQILIYRLSILKFQKIKQKPLQKNNQENPP